MAKADKRFLMKEHLILIGYEVKGNLVDSDLFDMFVKEKVYELLDKEG